LYHYAILIQNIPTMPDALKHEALRDAFNKGDTFTASEILDFYIRHGESELNSNTLLSRIHHLKRKGVIASVSKGVFTLGGRPALVDMASTANKELIRHIQKFFPHIRLTIWNTSALAQLTGVEPEHPITLIETDKEATETLFNRISREIPSVFLNPDTILYERYIPLATHPVVIIPLISEAPLTTYKGISLPTPEKLAVDLLSETTLFKTWQGSGTRNYYKRIFSENVINKSTLYRYARRRSKASEVKAILKNLNLEL